MAGDQPTPAALVDELKKLYDASTMEELAAKTGVSLRNLYRWKAGKGLNFDHAVEFFRLAGWLNLEPGDRLTAAQRERTRRLAARMARELEDLAASLGL